MSMEPTRVILRRNQPAPAGGGCAGPGVPDLLVAATVRAAVRVAQGKATSVRLLSRGTTQLVRDALRAIAQDRWRLEK
jgi:hypothetical protein